MSVNSSIVKPTEPILTEFAPNIKPILGQNILQEKLFERIDKINPYLGQKLPNSF